MIVTSPHPQTTLGSSLLSQHHPVCTCPRRPLAPAPTASRQINASSPGSPPPCSSSSSTPTPLASLPTPSALSSSTSAGSALRRLLPLLLSLPTPSFISLCSDLLLGQDALHTRLLPHGRVLGRDLGFAGDSLAASAGGEFDVEQTGRVGSGERDVVKEETGLEGGGGVKPRETRKEESVVVASRQVQTRLGLRQRVSVKETHSAKAIPRDFPPSRAFPFAFGSGLEVSRRI